MAKNIFENFDFDLYHELLEAAKEDEVHIVHTFNKYSHKGGFTIAWQRAGEGKNSRMVNVAISYCSPEDYFARKVGALHALENAYSGKYIQLPIGSEDSEEIVIDLRSIFDVYGLYGGKP